MNGSFVGWPLSSLGLVAALALTSPVALPAAGEKDGPGREVEELIRQLGDKQFPIREAATRRLMELPQAIPALREALQSPNPEVARRAGLVLKALDRWVEQRTLARLKEHARHGEVDQAVELLVGRPQWADEHACWQALTGLAAALIERGRQEFGVGLLAPDKWLWNLPAGDFGRYVKVARPLFLTGTRLHPNKDRKFKEKHSGFVARGTDVVLERSAPYGGALIAAAGGFRSDEELHSSVIFAGGPVAMPSIGRSVLVCDGDLKADSIGNSLVIVRGDVYCIKSGDVLNSLIILSGRFHLGKYTDFNKKTTKVRQQQADLLGFVKFFDPAREGVEVEAAKRGVRIKAVTAAKPLARAGLAAGDLIVGVNGQPAESPEVFRRLLRRTFVTGESTLLRVERDGKRVEVRVPGRP